MLLPHHAPEVADRADDGSLSGNVHLLLPTVALRSAKSRLSGSDAVFPGPTLYTQALPGGSQQPRWLRDKLKGRFPLAWASFSGRGHWDRATYPDVVGVDVGTQRVVRVW